MQDNRYDVDSFLSIYIVLAPLVDHVHHLPFRQLSGQLVCRRWGALDPVQHPHLAG